MLKLADNLKLPLDVVTEKLAWLGRTGSGKTYGAMKLAELMLDAGAMIGALDPVGVWRGLRAPAKKGGPSYDVVVFGGLTPDIPVDPTEAAGGVIADFVCDRSLSFVLDVSQFIPSEQQRIVRGFAARFFQRRKAKPFATHLFMEECQEFLPENASGREEPLTLGVLQRLWKLGRNFGIGGSLITQRPQEVSKKALNMSGTMFAFQMTGPQERKTVRSWVVDHGIATDIESVLQTLKRGQPHVEMHIETPDRRVFQHSGVVAILPRVTADLSGGVSVGSSKKDARPLTPIDLKELNAQLQASIEKAKADDPRELQKRIADLEKQLKASPKSKIPNPKSTDPKVADVKKELTRNRRALEEFMRFLVKVQAVNFDGDTSALQQAVTAAVNKVVQGIEQRVTAQVEKVEGLKKAAATAEKNIRALLDSDVDLTVQVEKRAPYEMRTPPPRAARPAGARTSDNGHGGQLPPAKQKILNGLAFLHGIGVNAADKTQLALIVGVSPTSGGYFNNLGALRSEGLIDYPSGGTVALTDAGAGLASVNDVPSTTDELHEAIRAKLPPAKWKILEQAIAAYPKSLSKDELAEKIGVSPTSGGYFNNLGSLRSLGLIDYPQPGTVAALPVLFLE